MTIGKWTADWVTDGTWYIDGGAMFGRVPRVLWERWSPPDELNRVTVTCRLLVLRSDEECVLVDAGLGRALGARLLEQTGINPAWELLSGLASLGITTDKVDYVILTHLHFDHVGGCVRRDERGELVPTFPHARHVVQKGEWEDAFTDNVLLRRSYVPDAFLPIQNAGLMDQLTGSCELLPGIHLDVTGGHSAHHQAVRVTDGDETLAYPADMLPLASQVNPAWVMAFDAYPLDSCAWRTRFLEEAEAGRWLVVLNHDPEHAAGRITREANGRYAWADL